jgi:signal transduction histidine kinase
MPKMGLRSRLFFSYMLVIVLSLGSFIVISKVSSRSFYALRLKQIEDQGFSLRIVRARLEEGFDLAWSRSTLSAVAAGGVAAIALSYWVARRITRPLTEIERITRRFASGHLEERVPSSEIPELNRLSYSFNSMATSLEGVEQRRRDLIGDLTHELRTPLTILQGYLEELADGRIEPDQRVYQRLSQETRRLERLITDLQELSRAETGYLVLHLQTLNLVPVLNSLVEKFSGQLLEDGPVLQLDLPLTLPTVLADPDRTEQILINLLGNALRYTQQGSITVSAWQEARFVWVAVADTGSGIAPNELPHIFERFWRSEQARSRYPGGTGIGLAITQHLVNLQGGRIMVSSELGKGSTFQFSLPIA